MVTVAVVANQLVAYRSDASRITQLAVAQAAVEAALHLAIEMLFESELFSGRQPVKSVTPAASFTVIHNAESRKPLLFFRSQLESQAIGNRIA
jgi:hypothetical protein